MVEQIGDKDVDASVSVASRRKRGLIVARTEGIVEALIDPSRQNRAAGLLLLAFVLVFTIFALVANSSSDVHHDFGELLGWGREPALGYNHPPLSAWIATAWFSILLTADWAAYLLSTVNAAVALWICWRLYGEWLEPEKRITAFALLTLIPFTTFNALIFNANTLLLPLWSAATLVFLRSVRERDIRSAALAGLACGAALLTKYWTVYLVAGLFVAALVHPQRQRYFRSLAPWVSGAVALIVIAPHLIWIARGGGSTLEFATSISAAEGATPGRSLSYLRDCVLYASAALIAYACLRPSRTALTHAALGGTPELRALAALFWVPLLLPALVNVVLPSRLTAAWTAPNWTLLPILLLAPAAINVSRTYLTRLLAVAIILPIVGLALAPAIAFAWHVSGPKDGKAHYHELAQVIEARWRAQTNARLTMIGGDQQMASGVAFYLQDKAATPLDQVIRKGTPPEKLRIGAVTGERTKREGIAYVCPAADARCVGVIEQTAGGSAARDEVELTRRYLGVDGKPERYTIIIVPPRP
jgi:hypothetical protein